ncbi:hypothetical protein [Halobaculum marinum]|uniref:Uncharacterized protein n=1 Tax=Halobaculum marinum TaxID=3031996 RepID=A0ABD5X0T3_9EURY|nr:hypothetical protein [Halobaculum sp. DT55]
MNTDSPNPPAKRYRETYEEQTVGRTTIATIADPDNDDAWIRSTLTQTVIA